MSGPLGNLPGLTYDPVRNRYFSTPAKAKPDKQSTSGSSKAGQERRGPKRKKEKRQEREKDDVPRRRPVYMEVPAVLSAVRRRPRGSAGSSRLARRRDNLESLVYASLSGTADSDDQPMPSPLTAVTSVPGHDGLLCGDQAGYIHAIKAEGEHPGGQSRWIWQDQNFGLKINSLHATPDGYIATTFGPRPRLALCPLPAILQDFRDTQLEQERAMVTWELTKLRDAWASSYTDGAITIGGDRQIVYCKDLSHASFRSLATTGKSDALAVHQINQDEAVVGLRSGHIYHYDFRLSDAKAASWRGQTSAVTNLHVLDDGFAGGRALIAGGFAGQLGLFDMRFPTMSPACTFDGHVNDVRTGLGLALSPNGTHLFAAGADRKIRCWDVRSGSSVLGRGGGRSNPLLRTFETPVTGLQMSERGVLAVLHGPNLEVYSRGKLDSWASAYS